MSGEQLLLAAVLILVLRLGVATGVLAVRGVELEAESTRAEGQDLLGRRLPWSDEVGA